LSLNDQVQSPCHCTMEKDNSDGSLLEDVPDESRAGAEMRPREQYRVVASSDFSENPSNALLKNDLEPLIDEHDVDEDLVSAVNYNTITSLAALKDMLHTSGEDSGNVDSFFHHYFLSHVNRLPSRNQTLSPYPWSRRLSECREEDEFDTEE
ncbi:hypothetical protein QAD02_003202, partial [Eretmocerus hayati]